MNNAVIVFALLAAVIVLSCVVFYQQITFQKGTHAKLREMSGKLKDILDTDSDEKVIIFTEDQDLIDLAAQMNRMLEDRQRVRADYRRSQIASRKMLSNISHDIKTPMTVILGYLEIIRANGSGQDGMLLKVQKRAEKVMELINQFFTLAKLEAGDMDVETGKVNINEVCRENVLDFYELLTEKGLQVEVGIPEETIFVLGNQDVLQRVLSNLISNAIRYGADGNYLGMFLRADDTNVYVDIVDKGKGIDPVFAGHVFERLFTMEDSRNREIQGNGLGLTIARNLMRQIDGDILLQSNPYERTTFTVLLKRFL